MKSLKKAQNKVSWIVKLLVNIYIKSFWNSSVNPCRRSSNVVCSCFKKRFFILCKPNGAVCAKLAIFSAIALKKWRFLSRKKPDYWRRHLPQIGMFTMACVSREKKKEPRGLILSKACSLFYYLRSGWSAAFPRSTWSGWRGTRSRPWESR